MDTNHTPEPWPTPVRFDITGPADDDYSCYWDIVNVGMLDSEEDAVRAVACVNACAGINPEAVPEMREALRAIISVPAEQFANARQFQAWCELKSRAALAKAEGK